MNPVKRHSGPTTLQDLEIDIVELKVVQQYQHEAAMTEIRNLAEKIETVGGDLRLVRDGLSSHGAPPKPSGKGKGKPKDDEASDEDSKPGGWGIRSGSGREALVMATAIITVLSSVGGLIQSFRNGSNASTAAYDGAQQAIEAAVEQGDAVPVAAPVIIPRPVPIPMPVPTAAPEPEPVTRPDDLLPQEGP